VDSSIARTRSGIYWYILYDCIVDCTMPQGKCKNEIYSYYQNQRNTTLCYLCCIHNRSAVTFGSVVCLCYLYVTLYILLILTIDNVVGPLRTHVNLSQFLFSCLVSLVSIPDSQT
jgi:hypothetical protein